MTRLLRLFSTSDAAVRGLVLALSALVLALSFGPVITHPNEYFFGAAGDAIRAYYIILYYVQHNQGLWFTGMNYPYGEHINFPDMQPLLSYPLSWLQHHGVNVAPHVIGILNSITLLSLLLTPLVLLAIGRRLGLPRLYAAAVALCVAFLAPQLERLDSHGSLAYTCLVPLLWYVLLRMREQPRRWRWPLLYGVICLFSGLLHTYFILVGALFLLAYTAVWLLQEAGRRPVWATAARWLAAALLPLMLFRSWLWLTDPVADRPLNPYGFFVYTARPTTVFVPTISPLREAMQAVLHTNEATWEGFAYVGVAGVLVALLTAIRGVQYLRRRQWRLIGRSALPDHLRTGLWAAALLLLLAMAFPFRLPGGEWLLEHLGPLKQFRSLGRFAWVFYYVFSLYTAYYCYRLYRYLGHHHAAAFGRTLLALVLTVWAAEAWLQISTKGRQIKETRSVRAFVDDAGNYRDHLAQAHRRAEEFQAILPLPYYNIGTDKLSFTNSGNSQFESYKSSLNTGLPLLANFITRTSVGQTLRLVQLVSSNLVEKPLAQAFPSRKPILLVVSHDALKPGEQQLVDRSRKLYEDGYVLLYELPFDSLTATVRARQLALFRQRQAALVHAPDGTWRTTGKSVVRTTFADRPAPQHFLEPGAFSSPDGFAQLYNGRLSQMAPADTGWYEVSVWVNARTAYGLGNLQVKQFAPDGQQTDHQVSDTSHSPEIIGDWVRASQRIHVTNPAVRVEVLYDSRDLLADELLIRPEDTDVYSVIGQGSHRQLVLNNYPLGVFPATAAP